MRAMTLLERLEDKISHEPNAGCWLWTGARGGGYGLTGVNGTLLPAHRVSYELHRGVIPDGLILDHLCRVRSCVNPRHLEPVTYQENVRRGLLGILKTHCPQGHPYDESNTVFRDVHRRHRECRTCCRERKKAQYAADPQKFRDRSQDYKRRRKLFYASAPEVKP